MVMKPKKTEFERYVKMMTREDNGVYEAAYLTCINAGPTSPTEIKYWNNVKFPDGVDLNEHENEYPGIRQEVWENAFFGNSDWTYYPDTEEGREDFDQFIKENIG